jgi:hypothetical protein
MFPPLDGTLTTPCASLALPVGACYRGRPPITEEIAMAAKLNWRTAAVAAGLVLSAVCGVARAADIPLVTGEHWMKSSEEVKKAYLVGIANFVQVENAYQASNPPTNAQSIVPRAVKGMKNQTLDSVRDGLNKWYASHPDQIQRPVIETIWFEMVVPGSK